MAEKKRPDLMVMTREQGVRPENPLMRVDRNLSRSKTLAEGKYYPRNYGPATPEIRKLADRDLAQSLIKPVKPQARKLGMTIRGKR